jgi:predicted alpha/beta hydrolase family esterase
VLAARILTRWPQLKVSAALLVAPADPDCSRRLASFAGLPDRALGVPATLVASRNDPWMTFAHSRHLADVWDASLIDLGFAGHINVASGFGPWPAALTLRDDLAERAGLPILRRAKSDGRRAIA